MIANYLHYIFGLTSLVAGLYLFLLSFNLYKPKYKTDTQLGIKRILEKYNTIARICSVILIIKGSYDLINPNHKGYSLGDKKTTEWAKGDRETLIQICISRVKPTSNYSKITTEYCECSTNKVIEKISKKEYKYYASQSEEIQKKEFIPIFQDCLTEFKQNIAIVRKDSIQKNR